MGSAARISFSLFDVTAKADCSLTAADVQPWVNLSDLKQDELVQSKCATLEHNQFILDGSLPLFPDEPEGLPWGLWSQSMSGADGRFAVPPKLMIDFTTNHSSLGLTLHFGNGEWASDIYIKWYNQAGFVIAERGFQPNGPLFFASHKVENYYKIEIEFRSTNLPYRYLKLNAIDYGVLKVFEGQDVVSANILEEVNILSSEISINTLNFTLHSKDAEFSILNPGGAFSALQQYQALRVQEIVDGQIIEMGTFYLDTWESETENTSRFGAMDLIGVIDREAYMGGVYSNITADNLIADILRDKPYELDIALLGIALSGYLPICTSREALQQVAFALGAVVDCSRSDKIKIYPPPARPSKLITYSRKWSGQTLKLKPLVTGVDVVTHTYSPSEEIQELFNDVLPVGVHTITFSEPAHSLIVTGAAITGSGANWARLEVSEEGTVVLSGKKYNVSNTVIPKRKTNLPANAGVNILRVEDATLVGQSNGPSLGTGIISYYDKRLENEFRIKPDGEMLADMVIVESMGGEKLKGVIERMEIDLTGGFIAKVRLVGVRIDTRWQDYAGEIYAGETKGVM